MITKKRIAFKPFQYQWAYDNWFKQQNAHWLHTEISMGKDVKDWNEELSFEEKNVVGNILKGFTQTECEVGDIWSSKVPEWFPVPEIRMMAQTFGAFETIHAVAYSYLNDTLGLDDFEGFLQDETIMEKLEALMKINESNLNNETLEGLRSIAKALGIFSAGGEGVQLFSSFAVLLSFRKTNRLKGIGQQMIFSVRDESLHSESGCRLFRSLIQENPDIVNASFIKEMYEAMDLVLKSEYNYIDKIFELGDLESITKSQLKNFMADRTNRKLKELGLRPVYKVDKELLEEMSWFYIMVSAEQQTDFFSNRETNYAKPNDDWNF